MGNLLAQQGSLRLFHTPVQIVHTGLLFWCISMLLSFTGMRHQVTKALMIKEIAAPVTSEVWRDNTQYSGRELIVESFLGIIINKARFQNRKNCKQNQRRALSRCELCQQNWVWDHLGDTHLDTSVRVFPEVKPSLNVSNAISSTNGHIPCHPCRSRPHSLKLWTIITPSNKLSFARHQ